MLFSSCQQGKLNCPVLVHRGSGRCFGVKKSDSGALGSDFKAKNSEKLEILFHLWYYYT